MRNICLFLVAAGILAGPLPRPAAAVMAFYKAFNSEYVENHPDLDFKQLVTKDARCLVCHQGRKRANRNAYGQQLDKLLDRKTDARDIEKILAALRKVGEMPVDPNDPDGETFSERIADGKLPGGTLEELKKELPEDKRDADTD